MSPAGGGRGARTLAASPPRVVTSPLRMDHKDPRRRGLATLLAAALASSCAAGGQADPRSLSLAGPEPAGDHCPAGGQRILTGIDANGDGRLAPGEILQVAYVCNRQPPATCTTLEGSVVIRNPIDWANLVQAGCTRITGTLEITAPGVTSLGAASPLAQVGRLEVWGSPDLSELRFPSLLTLDDGAILSGFPALVELQLPSLTRVGAAGLQLSGAPLLTAIDLPALSSVEGSLGLYENPRVTRVSLPALASLGDSFTMVGMPLTTLRLPALVTAAGLYVGEAPALTSLELPVLAVAGHLILSDDPALVQVSAPALATAGILRAGRLPGLTELALPSLEEVPEDLTLEDLPALTQLSLPALHRAGYFSVAGAAQLPSLMLPALAAVDGSFSVSGAARLTRLDAPLLRSVGSALTISGNPALPQCQAETLLTGLLPPLPPRVDLTGNDAAGTCP